MRDSIRLGRPSDPRESHLATPRPRHPLRARCVPQRPRPERRPRSRAGPAARGGGARSAAPGDRRERNLAELRAILDTEAAGKIDPRDRFADKVANFYASCMDEQGVEGRGLDELRAAWARLDGL